MRDGQKDRSFGPFDAEGGFGRNGAGAVVENGSWSPQAGGLIEETVGAWKNMRKVGEKVTLVSAVKEETREKLKALGEAIAEDVKK